MEQFRVHILGCGSALPTLHHMASSQVVELRDKQFMVDCGEGTQLQIRRSRINFNKIQAVFISHIHGDHCFGLIGMISTFGLQGRKSPLQVYAPAALGPMLQSQIALFCQHLRLSSMPLTRKRQPSSTKTVHSRFPPSPFNTGCRHAVSSSAKSPPCRISGAT